MAYEPLDFADTRTLLLGEYRNKIPGADVSEDSEVYARVSTVALGQAQLSYGLKYVERQIFPDSADFDNLKRHASLYGITPKSATGAAGGTVRLTGTNGTYVSTGLGFSHDDGTTYVSTSAGTISGGVLDVRVDAISTGSSTNKIVDDVLDVSSPPAGVDGTATVVADFAGGTDDESQAELLERVLARMRYGNAGGTASDYEQWALTLNGTFRADCLPLRRGAGTVSVAVYTEGVGGYRAPADSTLRAAVLAHLETVRPVTADVDVPAITEVPLDVEVGIETEAGYDADTVQDAVALAITDYIYSLETGETLYVSRLGRTISAVAGVLDYALYAPAANTTVTVSPTLAEVLVPGTIEVDPMSGGGPP